MFFAVDEAADVAEVARHHQHTQADRGEYLPPLLRHDADPDREEHDEECDFKLLPCPSGCGTEVMRKEVHSHVRDKCSLRAAECPLGMLGCTAIVQAQDITSHLNGQADKHFMLMATRMAEYQTVMKDLSAQVRLLEEKNGRLERRLQWATTQLQSKDEAKVATNEMKRLAKRLATLEGTCKREFKKVEQDRRSHQK